MAIYRYRQPDLFVICRFQAATLPQGSLTIMTIDEITANFALLDDWDDRYRYVIELGRTLEPCLKRREPTRIRCQAARARCG